ncbi:MAG: hypothetical protein KDB60_03130 [Propionibacteriaceae bacterium]|nr:hypothetical protein [Propionibacteriaceae bacterium]
MSYDLEIYGRRPVPPEQLRSLLDIRGLRIQDADESGWSVLHADGEISAAGPLRVVADDVPEDIEGFGRGGIRYEVEVKSGIPAEFVDRTLQRFASALDGGIIYEPGVGVRWPPPAEPTAEEAPDRLTEALAVRWFGRTHKDAPPVRGFADAAEQFMPAAMPQRFGLKRRAVAEAGLSAMEQEWREQRGWHILAFTMRSPFDVGGLTTLPAALQNVQHVWQLDLLLPAEPYRDPARRAALREFFTEVAERTSAGYAFAQVLGGAVAKGRRVELRADTEQPCEVFDRQRGLLGLTPFPVWWSWFGPAYQPLVADQLAHPPAGWTLVPTAHGTLVSLGENPAGPRGLPATWFPGGLRAHRPLLGRGLRAARSIPDWSAS